MWVAVPSGALTSTVLEKLTDGLRWRGVAAPGFVCVPESVVAKKFSGVLCAAVVAVDG